MAAAASSPAVMPASFAGPSGIAASAAARKASSVVVLPGRNVTSAR
jgi:hypothetical protein